MMIPLIAISQVRRLEIYRINNFEELRTVATPVGWEGEKLEYRKAVKDNIKVLILDKA